MLESEVEKRQTDRVEEIIEEVDDTISVVLSPEQRSYLDEFCPEYGPRHATLLPTSSTKLY